MAAFGILPEAIRLNFQDPMAHYSAHHSGHPRDRYRQPRRAKHSPLYGPVIALVAATLVAVGYVAYVLWPRWPAGQVSLDAPSIPITIAGTVFSIEPAAIRISSQRKPGMLERIDLTYLWPSLSPPDPAVTATLGKPIDPNERLFVTISGGEATLPATDRMKTIYPRYFAQQAEPGPTGLTLRAFRDGTPYQGEDLIYDPQDPDHFLTRCTRTGIGNAGSCLMERRIENVDLVFRFPREWLDKWEAVAQSVDKLVVRLHPDKN